MAQGAARAERSMSEGSADYERNGQRRQEVAKVGEHKQWMTYREAAAYYSEQFKPVSERTVRRWVSLGLLDARKPTGKDVAIPKAAIDALLNGGKKRR